MVEATARTSPNAGELARLFLEPQGDAHVIRKAACFIDLTDNERAQLFDLTRDSFIVAQGTQVQQAGDITERILIVMSGALMQVTTDSEGRRQSTRYLFPGDGVGSADMAMHHYASDVTALTDCRVVEFSKRAFEQADDTRMWRLFFLYRHIEQAIANDRVRVLARGRADERILHLFLEVNARQRLTEPEVGDLVWLPVNQTMLADATGLTNVYISKTLSRLRERQAIATDGPHVVRLIDRERLAERIEFVDRYADLDPTHAQDAPEGGLTASGE